MPQLTLEELNVHHLSQYWAVCAVNQADTESRILWESGRLAPMCDASTASTAMEHVEIVVPTLDDIYLRPIKLKLDRLKEELNSPALLNTGR